jgi:hypothetical protein
MPKGVSRKNHPELYKKPDEVGKLPPAEAKQLTPEEVSAQVNPDDVIKAKELRISELEAKEKLLTDKLEGKIPLIPSEFRRVVDEILGEDFGLDVQTQPDVPRFSVAITVPNEYSNLTKQELELRKKDVRSRMIPNSEGLQGVKVFAELVRKNLKSAFETNRPQPTS